MKLLNIVLMAEDYYRLIKWYKDALNLEVIYEVNGHYHYSELGYNKEVIIGIAPATEMEHSPTKPRNNSSIIQLGVSNINASFKQIEEQGGVILFGPSYEEQNMFYYGGVADIEGNQIWFNEESK